MTNLNKLKKLCDEATEGPWLEREDYDYYQGGTYLGIGPYSYGDNREKVSGACYFETDVCRVEDGVSKDFIAASRTALPKLIEIVEMQQKQLEIISWYEKQKGMEGPAGIAKEALDKTNNMLEDSNEV